MNKKFDAEHLSALCRIKITDKEKLKLNKNLGDIVKYIDLLEEVDTSNVPPCTHVLETMTNVLREDTRVEDDFDKALFFANAPDHSGKMIKTPPVIQFEE